MTRNRGMATSCLRREGVPAKVPKFFKIIFDPKARGLRIPAEFTRRYGRNLPNRIFLKVPSGPVLEAELIRSNGETWLQNGWQEFKEYFRIGFGHFLVFEYNGDSQFDVLIFDTTATEIDYPSVVNNDEGIDVKTTAHGVPNAEDTGSESDDSVVLLEEFLTSKKGKGKAENLEDADETENDVCVEIMDNPQARQQNRRKRLRSDDIIEFSDYYRMRESDKGRQNLSSCIKKNSRSKVSSPNYHSERVPGSRLKLDESTSGLDFQSLTPKLKEECSDGTGRRWSHRIQMQRKLAKETCIAYQKAIAFKSDQTFRNPFFIALMQQSYVSNTFCLNVPLSFAKGNLPYNNTTLTLRVSDGKAWSVRCKVQKVQAQMSSGWKDFVQDNTLKVGDACIFEVAKSTKLVWDVIIFRC